MVEAVGVEPASIICTICYFSKSFTPLSWSGCSAFLALSWKAYSKTGSYDICISIVVVNGLEIGKITQLSE
jgi:hypothetical protein